MPKKDASILQLGQTRIFIQSAVSPGSVYEYKGRTTLAGPALPLGDVSPIYAPSSVQANQWEIVGDIPTNPALATTEFTARMSKVLRDIWWDLKERGCRFNLQVLIGSCRRPDDFSDWESKIFLPWGKLTAFNLPQFNPLSGEENAEANITGSITARDIARLLQIRFEEAAASTVVAEVLDGIYYDTVQCGECGAQSDGCQHAYFLTKANAGSPGLSSQIVYTTDDKSSWNTLDIPTLGGLSGRRFAAMGTRMVMVSEETGSHHAILFSDIDAGNASGWVEYPTGYVGGAAPRCIFAPNSNEAYIGAAGGYIYKLSSPTGGASVATDNSLTTENSNDISGYADTIVSVHDNNVVLLSINGGDSFVALTGPSAGNNLSAVDVTGEGTWFVGTGNGELWYTIDSGLTYTRVTLDSSVNVINRIRFIDEFVGYMSVEAGGVARVYRTDSCGNRWDYQAPSIAGLDTTATRINALAPCGYNEVAAGGLVTGGDGIIAIAS